MQITVDAGPRNHSHQALGPVSDRAFCFLDRAFRRRAGFVPCTQRGGRRDSGGGTCGERAVLPILCSIRLDGTEQNYLASLSTSLSGAIGLGLNHRRHPLPFAHPNRPLTSSRDHFRGCRDRRHLGAPHRPCGAQNGGLCQKPTCPRRGRGRPCSHRHPDPVPDVAWFAFSRPPDFGRTMPSVTPGHWIARCRPGPLPN